MSNKFKVGDMVVLTEAFDYAPSLKVGSYGRIVEEDKEENVLLVEFFDFTGGHRGNGFMSDGVGGNKLWVDEKRLQLIIALPKGTRVRYIGISWDDTLHYGQKGTVYGITTYGEVDVVWENLTDGHDGDAEDKSSNHYYVALEDLEVINDFRGSTNETTEEAPIERVNPFVTEIKQAALNRSHVYRDSTSAVLFRPVEHGNALNLVCPFDEEREYYMTFGEIQKLRDYLTDFLDATEEIIERNS